MGGGGVVIECLHSEIPHRRFALKFARPSLLSHETKEADETQVSTQQEALRTAMLSHVNVAYLVGLDTIFLPMQTSPGHLLTTVSLLEWIEGAQHFSDYVYNRCKSVQHFVTLLKQVLQGLDHIHQRGLVHWDIKSDNCLIGDEGTVKIVDIGNARTLMDSEAAYPDAATILTSKVNMPLQLHGFINNTSGTEIDENRVRVGLRRGDIVYDRPWIDLYMFGRMVRRMLDPNDDQVSVKESENREEFLKRVFPPNDDDSNMARQFLGLIIKRLTIEPPPPHEGTDPEKGRYYLTAKEVDSDLDKLLPEYGAASDIPELYSVPQHVIRLPITRNTVFSFRISELINSAPVKRLARHQQLGLTKHVYPGAWHVRFEHVIGVLGTTLEYVRALYADRESPYFRLLCDSIHIRALLFAAVVHDLGHGSFSHYLEEFVPLFDGCSHEDYAQAVLRNDPSLYAGFVSHEEIEADRRALEKVAILWVDEKSSKGIESFLVLVADILKPPSFPIVSETILYDRVGTEKVLISVLHSILDSPLDSDKLDYLRRDAAHAGLDYANGADVDRFFQSLTVAIDPPRSTFFRPDLLEVVTDIEKPQPTICISRKGVLPLESLLVARYQIFNALYWHHTARAFTVIINYLVWRSLQPRARTTKVGSFEQERAELLANFRMLSDELAIDWLAEKLATRHPGGRVGDTFKRLVTIVRDREDPPLVICEICPTDVADELEMGYYDDLIRNHESLNRRPLDQYRTQRTEILRSLSRKIVSEVNELATHAGRTPCPLDCLDETVMFPDIPLGHKDQVDNLFVVTKSNGFQDVRDFHRYSPISTAIRRAFQIWSRRVRVFVHPEIAGPLIDASGSADTLQRIAFKSLVESYAEVMGGGTQHRLTGIESQWDLQ